MNSVIRFFAATILVSLVLTSQAAAQCVSSKHLSGAWHSNDGGTYYVKRIGHTVWWMGESPDNGVTFTNVFRGTWNEADNTITGDWTDVAGNFDGNGTLTLKINGQIGVGVHGFDKIGATGAGFGGQHWFKPCNDTN